MSHMETTLAPTPRRLRDGLRALATAAVTPLVPADYLDLFAPVRSSRDLRARIVAVQPETKDAATIVLRPGPTWRSHVPGQYLRIGVDIDGVRQWRAYSLTSAPDRTDGLISITVKAIPDGRVSNHLVRRAAAGDIVHLEQASGDFVLPTTAPTAALFIVAGSGITPAMGMVRSRLDELADVVVVHCAMTEADAIFREELREFAAAGRLRLVEQFTDRDGLLTMATLAELVTDLDERETWACGPAGLLHAIEQDWAARGRPDLLHVERFASVVLTPGEGGRVTFAASDTTVDVDGATSLLDAGEAAGVLMPSGCRMGVCFGCVAPLRSGAVRDLRNGEITLAEPGGPAAMSQPNSRVGRTTSGSADDRRTPSVTIQTCISTAAAGCEIDL